MEQAMIEAVRRMQRMIEENLKTEITIRTLAEHTHYSPWYCIKIFKELTGKTPLEYVRLRRLTEASKSLQNEDIKVVDVAFDFYFQSQEGFTKAFSKAFGITPKQYALHKPPIRWFMSYPVSPRNPVWKGDRIRMKKEVATVFTQVIEKPRRTMLIKRGIKASEYFAYCEEVGCDVWGVLCSVHEALDEPMGMWLPKKLTPEGTSSYIQGVEVPMDYQKPVPEGYELVVFEPCKLMIFQGPQYQDDNFEEEILSVKEAIDGFDPKIYGYVWADEEAPSFQYEPQGDRGYIEGRPVREK